MQFPYQAIRSCGCRWQGFSRHQTLPELHGHCHEPTALPSWEDPSPDALWPVYIDHTEVGKNQKKKGYSRNFTVTPSQYIETKTWHLQSISLHTGSGWHLQQLPALRGSCFLSAAMCRHGPPLVGTIAHNLGHRKT